RGAVEPAGAHQAVVAGSRDCVTRNGARRAPRHPQQRPTSPLELRSPGTLRASMTPRMAVTGFFTDSTLCIGCKACEVACKEWNEVPDDGFRWSGLSYATTLASRH